MLSKISFRNVKRSFKDYTIYFLTLTFAVCIFYAFNSISSQQVMINVTKSQKEIMKVLSSIISATSVFVSIILGFLIIYANNFLIKRRKKEIGVYMTLGMSKKKISSLLVRETFLIGLISLVVGLGLGVVISQGLSLFTTRLFDINVSKYNFIFSYDAAAKTILYFGIIFILVMLFNTVSISRYKLIDLLRANRKNEVLKIKKPKVSFAIFILALLITGIAYILILKDGLTGSINIVNIAIILGILGTFLFFLSLSGFLISVLQKGEKFYLNKLNMFVLRQINSKVNTTYVSMSLIALMLFLTTTLLSTGFSFKNSMEKSLEMATPYDVTFYSFDDRDRGSVDPKEALDKVGFNYKDKFKDYLSYNIYNDKDNRINQYIGNYVNDKIKKNLNNYGPKLECIKISDFNKLRQMSGEDTFNLKDNEVIIVSNFNEYSQAVNKFLQNNRTMKIGDKTYSIVNKKALTDNLETSGFNTRTMLAVVPDEDINYMEVSTKYFSGNFKVDSDENEDEIYDLLREFTGGKYNDYGLLLGQTRKQAYDSNLGLSTTILYIGIYMGIIFLISSAAVLALQQLSEASDNIERYAILKKIGTSSKLINKSILSQIGIYFLMPLGLAIIHSIVGITVVSNTLSAFGESNILIPSIITATAIIIIYGGYFIATYLGYKNIIKNK